MNRVRLTFPPFIRFTPQFNKPGVFCMILQRPAIVVYEIAEATPLQGINVNAVYCRRQSCRKFFRKIKGYIYNLFHFCRILQVFCKISHFINCVFFYIT